MDTPFSHYRCGRSVYTSIRKKLEVYSSYTSTVHLPHLYRMYTVTCGVYSTGYCTVFLVPIMVSSYVHAYERDAYVMTVPRYAYLST